MNHRRKRRKHRRESKLLAITKGDRARDRELALQLERVAYEEGRVHDKRHVP